MLERLPGQLPINQRNDIPRLASERRRQGHGQDEWMGRLLSRADALHHSVRPWTWGRTILGIIDDHHGLPGVPPVRFLTEVRYDPLTGKIGFDAKLTGGPHSCDKHKGIPSHDQLSFTGVLESDRPEADLVLQNQLDSPPVVLDQRKSFVMPRQDDCRLDSHEIYEI